MTWRIFTNAIRDAKITNDVPWRIINDLFMEAGCTEELAEPTVRTWLNGKRNCDSRRYFPNKQIDHKRVFAFFKNRSEEKLQKLQKIFQEIEDTNSPIDVKTGDLDVFCWSLVNQFLDLLGFQRIDIPHTESNLLLDSRSTSEIEVSPKKKPSIRSTILPHSEDCCYRCIHWNGNRKTFGAYMTPTYGYCFKYDRAKQVSSAVACEDFEKREKQMGEW